MRSSNREFEAAGVSAFDEILFRNGVSYPARQLRRFFSKGIDQVLFSWGRCTLHQFLEGRPDRLHSTSLSKPGSILPLGAPVESTKQLQRIDPIRIYPREEGNFTLYQNDGETYEYETSGGRITHLHWDESHHEFTHHTVDAWSGSDSEIVQVVRP